MIGVIYLNWYTAEGSGGIPGQITAATAAAQRNAVMFSPVGNILDANTTPGTNPTTLPGFQQLQNLVRFGTIDTVLVATLNRLAQDAPNFAIAMQALRGLYPLTMIISAGGWDTLGGDQVDAVTAMLAGK